MPAALPHHLPVALREALAAANAARHDWIARAGQQQREVRGVCQRTADLRISTTDPDATPMRLKGGGTHLGYQTHYVVDGGKRRIIVGVLMAPGEVMENQPMLDLLWRVRFRWTLRPRQVTGDTKYGTVENIRAVEDMGIRAYVPLPDWEQHSAYFGASKFTYNSERDHYVCPNGQVLRRTHTSEAGQRILYRAPASTCRTCPLRAKCTPGRKCEVAPDRWTPVHLGGGSPEEVFPCRKVDHPIRRNFGPRPSGWHAPAGNRMLRLRVSSA
ncbi:MAG TPA: transposase [Ktedonobacterales bacterium]|nr:transposase [Ktedonobacterales bacterium]